MFKKNVSFCILVALLFGLIGSSSVTFAQSDSLAGYEKIASPKDIPLFSNIKKVGTSLWGVRKTAVASNDASAGYEKIASPKDIALFDKIKKIGTSLWGIRKTKAGSVAANLKTKLANQTKIKKFKDVNEIKNFLSKNVGSGSSYYGNTWGGGARMMETTNGMAQDSMALPSGTAKSASEVDSNQVQTDFSGTNVQIAGVDEADIIKTDGKYAYAVVDNNVYIINAYPADKAEIVSKIEFKDRPQDVYVKGNNLIIYGADNNIVTNSVYKNFRRRGNFTFFKVFDISDKKNPKLLRDLSYEGNYYNSRMIGDYVYFLTSNYIYNYYYDNEVVVPRVFSKGQEIRFCEGAVRCPPVYYFDLPYDSYNFVNVAAINVHDNKQNVNNEVYLLSDNQNFFVSEKNMYITYTKYISEEDLAMESLKEIIYPKLSQEYKDRIAKIETADEMVVTQAEKTRKIMSILQWYIYSLPESEQQKFETDLEKKMKQKYADISRELEKTVIHKIAINKEKIEYKLSGEVVGQVLNQFSMDEKDGYFRIATTKSQTWSQYADAASKESNSNLYVLDGNLKVVGAVEKLAKGERIYSVRFMGDRAYLVTFKQVDPLFVIDLKNPLKPVVAGELKIPGFSNYLHPYDENTLIGLGKETTENTNGRVVTGGIKLSLFDVSDLANPKEIGKYVLGESGSYSIAESEHKAFLFNQAKNLLVIPVSLYEKTPDYSSNFSFSGAAVFKVDKTGFTLRGKIDHSDGGHKGINEPWWGYNYYDNTVKRSFYINDILYTFSSRYLQTNKLDTLEPVKKLELKKEKDDFTIVN